VAEFEVISVVDRVYAALRERIMAGEIAPDERLHQEALAEELGVSRTPLREALSRLAADGLVELLPNRGARVAAVSAEDMEAAYEARLHLEPAAAGLAAQRAEPADLEPMRHAIADHRRAVDDLRRAFMANRAFHLAVVEAAHNPYLLRFAEGLWGGRAAMQFYLTQPEPPAFIATGADDHEAVLDAIAGGDARAAQRLMRDHIVAASKLLRDYLAEEPPVPVAEPG
jgi:DNA-binding GntR family transcriptional regulator